MTMLAVAVTKPNQVQVVDIPKPTPGPYEALIKTEVTCLCNMTDRKLIEGHFPGVETYPLLLGHETVGIVEVIGEKVKNFKPGDRVVGGLLLTTPQGFESGWGGFSEYTLAGDYMAMAEDKQIPLEVFEIMCVVPKTISVEDAVMLCTWREVYGAFEDFHLQHGDNILVYGAGPVGLSFVKFARLLGLGDIFVIDRWEHKRSKALEMGATATFAPDDPKLQTFFEKRQRSLDAVIDAVGTEDIINTALPLVKMGGSICVYGVIDTPSIRLDKHLGPYNFNLFIHQWPTRSRERAAQEPLVTWIEAGKLSHKEFLSVEFPIGEIVKGLEYAKAHRPIKTLFRF
jgi:threonine dehydrogenase-like Zn-dependent dehydrogenase